MAHVNLINKITHLKPFSFVLYNRIKEKHKTAEFLNSTITHFIIDKSLFDVNFYDENILNTEWETALSLEKLDANSFILKHKKNVHKRLLSKLIATDKLEYLFNTYPELLHNEDGTLFINNIANAYSGNDIQYTNFRSFFNYSSFHMLLLKSFNQKEEQFSLFINDFIQKMQTSVSLDLLQKNDKRLLFLIQLKKIIFTLNMDDTSILINKKRL